MFTQYLYFVTYPNGKTDVTWATSDSHALEQGGVTAERLVA